jgi:hypothetical protein
MTTHAASDGEVNATIIPPAKVNAASLPVAVITVLLPAGGPVKAMQGGWLPG